jgi:hypothetical protein
MRLSRGVIHDKNYVPKISIIKKVGLELVAGSKTSLSGDFMSLFPTHPDFRNGAEEFHPHETLSVPMKLLSSLFVNMVPHQHN